MLTSRTLLTVVLTSLLLPNISDAHEKSLLAALRQRAAAEAKAKSLAEETDEAKRQNGCKLTIELADLETDEPLAGLIRITSNSSGKAIQFPDQIHRALNWYSVDQRTVVRVPRTKLRIQAIRGLETATATLDLDLSQRSEATAKIRLRRFYDASAKGLQSGNTHLHLMKLTFDEAIRYLQVVPKSDDLDLVFLSHLRRAGAEKTYISNEIVEGSFQGASLKRLSQDGVLFSNGEEHRHNFGPGDQGFGHVMLLDLKKLVRPVSIGPGIMKTGTDGIPLQRGIKEARLGGATIIWCHNGFGFEDLPNWLKGMLHAQNIFDGGNRGSYQNTYYRYLNLGLQVPFSTGTDWFIYDFARVYIPVKGELTSKKWLANLQQGRSYITNGPFLEFTVDEKLAGETIDLSATKVVTVSARGIGRQNFAGLELIHNGNVVHQVDTKGKDGHYECRFDYRLKVDEPGWIALRIVGKADRSELDRPLFAHTSPIYIEFDGRRIFRKEVAQELLKEMTESIASIEKQAKFGDEQERKAVLSVYQEGIRIFAAEDGEKFSVALHNGREDNFAKR